MIGSISNRFGVSMPFIVVLWSSWAANPTLCDQLLHHQQAPSSYYGVDISWPIQHGKVSSNFPWLSHNVDPQNPIPEEYKDMPIQPLGDRQKKYDEFMQGCYDHHKEAAHMCDETEKGRFKQCLTQPPQMTNYTELGFKKIRAPEAVFNLIKEFWETNKHLEKSENLEKGYTFINYWETDTTMVSVDDSTLTGAGPELKQVIFDMALEVIEEWTGQRSTPTSLYGIRIYKSGSILAPHVDRLPLVSSMIINVDQDIDEDWPLEVYGHDGKAYNVTMKPGDLVLYESHSIIHGRPFPLKGRFFANIFIHFEPAQPKTVQVAAQEGDLKALKDALKDDPLLVHLKDENWWQASHEAARGGHNEILAFLAQEGAKMNSLTKTNATVLDIALSFHDVEHPVVNLIRSLGGVRFSDMNTAEDVDESHNEL